MAATALTDRSDQREKACKTEESIYALTLAELDSHHLPEARRKKLPRRIPGVRLGRLAVHKIYQGKGLGELLLVDALIRARRIYAEAGGIGLFVDALDEQTADYYRRFGFEAAPDNPLLLFIPTQNQIKTALHPQHLREEH